MRRDEFPIIDKHVQNEITAVLDKIRAEIEGELEQDNHSFYRAALGDVLKIIDKYREGEQP